MYCKSCGKEIVAGIKFCKYCGAPIDEVDTTAKPTQHTVILGEEPKETEMIITDPGNPSIFLGTGTVQNGTVVINPDKSNTEILSAQNTSNYASSVGTLDSGIARNKPLILKYKDHFLNENKAKLTQYSGKKSSGFGVVNIILLILLILIIAGAGVAAWKIMNRPVENEIKAPKPSAYYVEYEDIIDL